MSDFQRVMPRASDDAPDREYVKRRQPNAIDGYPYPEPERPDPEAWRRQALCREVDPEIFHPRRGRTDAPRRDTAEAKSVCAQCPVRAECLAYALAMPAVDDWGIWGGTTKRERRIMREKAEP